MTFNPYKILGVRKNAGTEIIRAAFKRLAKQHHPDVAGGENETFNRIRAAYDLLMNDQQRKLYDDFGAVPGDDASQMRLQAIHKLKTLFAHVLNQMQVEQLERTDIIGTMEAQLERDIAATEKNIADTLAMGKRAEKALAIIRRRSVPSTVAQQVRSQTMFREMLALLKNYTFEFEQAEYFTSTSTSGVTSGGMTFVMRM